ncbi:MAG: hypothetical protein LKI39_08245 [Bacteroides sp.]|jgi:hypothetical protein|nr:hypothetical protein [Bacteroides sp.]MCI1682529.1 hypothetical protein [Bacteroides sp.]
MKKSIFTYFLALLGIVAISSCSDDEGTAIGNDSKPAATVYQYPVTSSDGDYSTDSDVRIRIATNNKVENAYYLAETVTAKEAYISSNGEDGYNQYVVSKGIKVTFSDGVADIIVTDLFGNNAITVVAEGKNGELTSQETTFYGYKWNDICTGRLYARFLTGGSGQAWKTGLTLQRRDDDPTIYRIKDAYGKGAHVFIYTQGDPTIESGDYYDGLVTITEGVEYTTITIPTVATPYTYSTYGTVSVTDYATYTPDESYLYYNRLYDNNFIAAYCRYSVSVGVITSNFVYFDPD